MNNTEATETRSIALTFLVPSEDNPRKTFDQKSLQELADSIKANGVQVPLLARPAKPPNQGYEIVCGGRRYLAAQMAKLKEVPCIVRSLTDEQASQARVIENLQRQELPPLEESEAFSNLLDELVTVQAVALAVSKPIEYITRRLKLYTLVGYAKTALGESLITLDHALLLAKLGADEQEKALRYTLNRNASRKDKTLDLLNKAVKESRDDKKPRLKAWEPESVVSLKRYIENDIKLELKRAPWDLADETLVPEAGACTSCESNTAHNAALFGDLIINEATCANSVCFNSKRSAYVARQAEQLKSAGAGALSLSWKSTSVKPRWERDDSGPVMSQTFKEGQWVEAKRGSCTNIRKGVTVDYRENTGYNGGKFRKPGEVLQVCVAPKCKAHPKDWEKKKSEPSRNQPGETHEARENRIAPLRKAYVESETKVRAAIHDAIIKSGNVTVEKLYRWMIAWAASESNACATVTKRLNLKAKNSWDHDALVKYVLSAPKPDLDSIAFDLFVIPELEPQGYQFDSVKEGRSQMWALAQFFGVDPDAIAKQVEAEIKAFAPTAPELAKPAKKSPAKKAAKKAAKKVSAPADPEDEDLCTFGDDDFDEEATD